MKTTLITSIVAVLIVSGVAAQAQYTAPTDAQLRAVLTANEGGLSALFEGASAEQAAAVVVRMIGMINTSPVGVPKKQQVIAVLTARMVQIMGDAAAATMAAVVVGAEAQWRPTIVVAAALAAGDDAEVLLDVVVKALGSDAEAVAAAREAATSPLSVLGPGLVQVLKQKVIGDPGNTGRGLMIIPLLPVADRYEGQ
jgi:hypothetical protein